MNKIYKYKLEIISERQRIEAPFIMKDLSIQLQNGIPCLWAAVNTDSDLILYEIIIVGTGCEVPQDAEEYIGTVQIGQFVWHFFKKVIL